MTEQTMTIRKTDENPLEIKESDTDEGPFTRDEFLAYIDRLRSIEGYTLDELVEITRNPRSTLTDWIAGRYKPTPSRIQRFKRDMEDPRTPISKRKAEEHHLTFDKSKRRWVLRFTVDLGAKVVGRRITYRLKYAKTGRQAIMVRDELFAAYEAIGLKIRPRIQKRKGGKQ